MTAARIFQVVRQFAVGELIELLQVDLTSLGGTVQYLTNNVMEQRAPIQFGGNTYTYLPLSFEDVVVDAQGSPSQPRLNVATAGGPVTALIENYKDLRGATVTRLVTFAEFLDTTTALELVTNGTFDTNTTGWTAGNSVLSSVAGRLRVTKAGTDSGVANFAPITVEIGKSYTIKGNAIAGTCAARLRVGSTVAGTDYAEIVNTSGSVTFTATAATVYISAYAYEFTTAGLYAEFDDISLQLADGSLSVIPNPLADGTAIMRKEVYVIDRKEGADNSEAQFLCVAPTDVEGAMLPRRIVRKRWCDAMYRVWDGSAWVNFAQKDGGCPYRGTRYYDENDNAVASQSQDKCSKLVSGCLRRFGYQNSSGQWVTNTSLPAQMFPGVRATQEA